MTQIRESNILSSLVTTLKDVSSDTTPQLGGNLDINGKDIVSTSNGNIDILPNGTGKVILDGNGSTGGVSISDGLMEMRSGTGSPAQIDFYCETNNQHKVSLKSPAHTDYSGNVVSTLPTATGTLLNQVASSGIYLGVSSVTATNLLDDYEEGTATLSFSSSGSTFQYSYQTAFYTKIGRMVNLVCNMQLDGGGNSFSGNTVTITGLPFTSINNAAHQATSACRIRNVNLGTGFTYLMATVGSNTTTVGLLQCGDNVATGTIGANQLSSSSGQVHFSLSYVTT